MFQKAFAFFFVFLLVSCTGIPDRSAVTRTELPAPPPAQITTTFTSTPTTTTPTPPMECLSLSETLEEQVLMQGALVLVDPDYHQISILDLQTNTLQTVYESPVETNVTTNRMFFAFAESQDGSTFSSVQVGDSKGEVIAQMPWNESWRTIVAWVNDEELLIDSPYDGKIPVVAHKINPFINAYQELSLDFPDIYPVYPPVFWGNYGLIETVYHPTFQYVIYPSSSKNAKVVLWDIKDEISIVSFPTFYFFGHAPQWSPDGNYFIINASVAPELQVVERGKKEELFQIGVNGEIKQLTQFTETKDTVQLGNFSWSPDGQSIAFWVKTSPGPLNQNVEHLAVLNLLSNEVVEYCVPGMFFGRTTAAPIWTQDNRYLIAETQYDEQNMQHQAVLLIDLAKQKYKILANALIPIGLLDQ